MAAIRNSIPHPPRGLKGTLLHDEPMSLHTSFRVGGPADLYYTPVDVDDLNESDVVD